MDVYRSRSADTLTRTLFKASKTRQRKVLRAGHVKTRLLRISIFRLTADFLIFV